MPNETKALHRSTRMYIITSIMLINTACFGHDQIAKEKYFAESNHLAITTSDKTSGNTIKKNAEPSFSDRTITFLDKHGNTLMRALTSALAVEAILINGSPASKDALINQLDPLSILKNLCINYTKSLLVTLGHESGHALTAHYLTNSPINIHIGKNSTDEAGNTLKLGGVSLDGINPDIGYSIYNTPIKDPKNLVNNVNARIEDFCKKNNRKLPINSPQELEGLILEIYAGKSVTDCTITGNSVDTKKLFTIAIAGGLTGLLVNYCFKLVAAYIAGSGDQSIFIKALTPDYQDIQQLFNLLMPIGICGKGESDSIKLYRSLGISEEFLNNVSQLELTPMIDLFASLGLEFARSSSTNNIKDLFALAMLNMSTRGFLRFNLP